jgi:hypothetical protein
MFKCILEGLSVWVEHPGCDGDHLSPFSADMLRLKMSGIIPSFSHMPSRHVEGQLHFTFAFSWVIIIHHNYSCLCYQVHFTAHGQLLALLAIHM